MLNLIKKPRNYSLSEVIDDFFNDPFDDYLNFPYINNENDSYFYEENNNMILEYKVPGLSKDDMKVTISDNYMTIQGEKENKNTNSFYSTEIYKKYYIPKNVDKTGIDATVKNGILKITFPKMENEENKKRTIKIN